MTAEATQTSTLAEDDGREPNRWWLELVHHDDPQCIGRRIEFDGAIALGRKSDAFGVGTLDDGHISRAHVELDRGTGGTPTVRDTGSRNGTYVNGSRVQEHPLVAGDGYVCVMVYTDRHWQSFAGMPSCCVSRAKASS